MRGDATLFTRNDEVEAQWRICDPIVQAWAQHAGAAAAVPRRLAGARRGGPTCSTGDDAGARSEAGGTRCGVSDSVWSAQGTTPGDDRGGAARAARRAPRRERGLRAGARAQPGLRRRQASGAARSPTACAASGRYHASRTIVLRGRGRPRPRSTRSPTIASDGEPEPGGVRAAARDGDRRHRRAAPRRPRHDRRPARRHRPADGAVVAARAHRRRSRRCCRSPRSCCWTRSTSRTSRDALARADELLRAASTSSTSPGCARRRGASAWPRPSTRRTCARDLRDDQRA